MPAFIYTLQKAFSHVYLFSPGVDFDYIASGTFIIAATDHPIDLLDFQKFVNEEEDLYGCSIPLKEEALKDYLLKRNPVLLTDDYAPTDILVAQIFK